MYATFILLDESESKEEDEEAKLNAAVRYSIKHSHACKFYIPVLSQKSAIQLRSTICHER